MGLAECTKSAADASRGLPRLLCAAMATNETHDPSLKSWVESANDPATDFPIQNLALCSFEKSHDGHTHDHMGVRIGEDVLDVSMLWESGFFDQDDDLAG